MNCVGPHWSRRAHWEVSPPVPELGPYVNWRCLRTSCATWQLQAGADPKSVQGQMRDSRISTTMEIYAQFVPEDQKRAAAKLTEYVAEQVKKSGPLLVQ
jgi:integrase